MEGSLERPGSGGVPVESAGETPRPRRRRFRVLLAITVVFAAAAAVPVVIRAKGRAFLAEVRSRHAAAGLGTSARELADSLPPIDEDQVRRCAALEGAVRRATATKMFTPGSIDEWLVGDSDAPPAEVDAELSRLQPSMEALAEAYREEGLLLGLAGRLPRGEAASRLRWKDLASFRSISLIVEKQAAHWMRLAALRSEDPGPYLDALEGQCRALRHPGSAFDALIGIVLSDARDRAHVDLAIRGRLPADRAARWLAEEPDQVRLCADGLRAERLLYTSAVADGLADGTLDAKSLARRAGGTKPWVEGLGGAWSLWLHGMRDVARVLEIQADLEARLRGRPRTLDPGTLATWREEGDGDISPRTWNFDSAAHSAVDARTVHRAARLLVRTLAAAKERGRFPEDEAELRAWLGDGAAALEPGPFDARIRYERLPPNVLRFAPDPDGPMPAIPCVAETLREYTLLAKPPDKRAIRWSSYGIEVHLAK